MSDHKPRLEPSYDEVRQQTVDDEDSRVCHAPGDRCLGCDHYYGKASVCSYTDTIEPDIIDHTRNALDAINKVRCMLISHAKSRRAYEKMTRSSEYAVSELRKALGELEDST